MKHFIRKSGSVVLDADLYKAVVGKNPSKKDIEEHVWHLVSEKYPQKDAVGVFHEILNNLRVESGLSQFRRAGKRRGQLVQSKDSKGNPLASGMGQQIASTAKRLNIDPTKWRESVEGMVKYKTQLAQQARKLGVPEGGVRKIASGSYFTGADERPENQAILAAARKENPSVTMNDILTKPQYAKARSGLKGMTKLMARHGVKTIVPGLKSSEKEHSRAVQNYIAAVHKDPKRHTQLDEKRGGGYEPVASSRKKAEQWGTRGYTKRDPTSGTAIASMPISQTSVRPSPVQSHEPISSPGRKERRAKEAAFRRSAGVQPTLVSGTLLRRSIKFDSELFVEE